MAFIARRAENLTPIFLKEHPIRMLLFYAPAPAIADDTALVCEKYVKKHPVDVSIATEGSGE
jgi:hypothetical protein